MVTEEPQRGRTSRRRRRCSAATSTASAASFTHSRRATDVLQAPRPRDERLVLALRAADLPRVHDPDAGRDALPGVRRRALAGARTRSAPARATRRATYVLLALNVIAFVAEVVGGGGAAALGGGGQLVREGGLAAQRWPTASGTGSSPRLPARRAVAPVPQHVRPLHPRRAPRARDRRGALCRRSTSSRCSAARSGRCCSTRTSSPSAPRARSSG